MFDSMLMCLDWDDEKERLYSEGLATSLDISLSSIKILSVLDGIYIYITYSLPLSFLLYVSLSLLFS